MREPWHWFLGDPNSARLRCLDKFLKPHDIRPVTTTTTTTTLTPAFTTTTQPIKQNLAHPVSALDKTLPLATTRTNRPLPASQTLPPAQTATCPPAPSTRNQHHRVNRHLRYMYSRQSHAFRLEPPPELQSLRSIRNPRSLHHCTNG